MKKTSLIYRSLIILAGILLAVPSFGQGGRTMYIELLGASNGLGINYDARFRQGASSGWGWRTGLGFGYRYSSMGVAYSFSDTEVVDDSKILDLTAIYNQCFRASVPLEINYLLGKGPSKLDLGAGGVFCAELYTSREGAKPHLQAGAVPYLSAGYRLVTAKGFVFRAGAIAPYSSVDRRFSFWPHLGFGWTF